jgi:hypothetical protein
MAEPTVTISTQGDKDDKLLYTLINGQIHKAKDAPVDLIPGDTAAPFSIGANVNDFENIFVKNGYLAPNAITQIFNGIDISGLLFP